MQLHSLLKTEKGKEEIGAGEKKWSTLASASSP